LSQTSIGINNIYYSRVKNVGFTQITEFSKPEWLNEIPTLDERIWVRHPQIISYTIQCNDSQKWRLDKLFQLTRMLFINDKIYKRLYYSWASSISASLTFKKDYPFEVTIDFTSIWETSSRNFGFERIDEEHKFEDGFERIDEEHKFEDGFERVYPFGT
jgi:hypothetical protein